MPIASNLSVSGSEFTIIGDLTIGNRMNSIRPEPTHTLEIFKDVMSTLASGVAVVTGLDPSSRPCGLTMTSIASYSADPPSIIICVDTSSYSYRGLSQGKYFAVNLLTADQANIAELFASKTEDKFQQCQYVVGAKGLLLIQDALASLICQRSFTATHGDHAVVIGDVIDGTVTNCDPLVHWRRSFHRMTDTRNR